MHFFSFFCQYEHTNSSFLLVKPGSDCNVPYPGLRGSILTCGAQGVDVAGVGGREGGAAGLTDRPLPGTSAQLRSLIEKTSRSQREPVGWAERTVSLQFSKLIWWLYKCSGLMLGYDTCFPLIFKL